MAVLCRMPTTQYQVFVSKHSAICAPEAKFHELELIGDQVADKILSPFYIFVLCNYCSHLV